jgi:hypothetical protein
MGQREAGAEARRGHQITIRIVGLRVRAGCRVTHPPLHRQFKSARTVQELDLKRGKLKRRARENMC